MLCQLSYSRGAPGARRSGTAAGARGLREGHGGWTGGDGRGDGRTGDGRTAGRSEGGNGGGGRRVSGGARTVGAGVAGVGPGRRWSGEDSNLRRQMPAGLQPAAFGRFATTPTPPRRLTGASRAGRSRREQRDAEPRTIVRDDDRARFPGAGRPVTGTRISRPGCTLSPRHPAASTRARRSDDSRNRT